MQPRWLPCQKPCSDKLARRRSRHSPGNDRAQFEDISVRPNSARSTTPANPSQIASRRMSRKRAARCQDASEQSPYQDADNELTLRLKDLYSNLALGGHVRGQP